MEKYCKNCGANINNAGQFCPDCGKEIPANKRSIIYCQNCGEKIVGGENFCKNCGTRINTPKEEKPGFWKPFKIPIIIIAVIVLISIISMGLFYMSTSAESQEVQVDTLNFNIPDYFVPDDNLTVDEVDDGVKYVSKYWIHDEDYIEIDVMYAKEGNVDANDVARQVGGTKQTLMDHDGYYTEFSDAYSFSFVEDNKLVTVYTSDYDLFDEIEVL